MPVTYRAGRIEDSQSVFQVFVKAIVDYGTHMCVMAITGGSNPEVLESLWKRRTHAKSLLAEKGDDFGAETPLINTKAIQYFIERRYQIDSFSAIFMSNRPLVSSRIICVSALSFFFNTLIL